MLPSSDLSVEQLKMEFLNCKTPDEIYEKLIELGKNAVSLDEKDKVEKNLVHGCQSIMYAKASLEDGKVYYTCDSEALISKGIATLLTYLLNGKTPEEVLKDELKLIQELKLPLLLSPSRSNGLKSLHTKMKREALHFLMQKKD